MNKSYSILSLMSLILLGMGTNASAQVYFEADWIYMKRNHDSSGNLVNGPESIPAGVADYDFEPGYRFKLGGDFFDYRVDASFTSINSWSGSSSGTLGGAVIFDDTALATDNVLSPRNVLRQAAMFNDFGANNETLESERLRAGATYSATSGTNYKDWEINIGTSEYASRYRFSGGFRRIDLDDINRVNLRGTFDALDTDDGAIFGDLNNDPNDALSHLALSSTGLVNVSGSGDGFQSFASPGGVDTLIYEAAGKARNNLSGGQVVFTGRVIDAEWITVETIGKAGVYHNNVSASVQETVAGSGNDNSVYRRTFSDNANTASFAGNVGLRGIVSLTDYVNLVAGYEVLFISNVALGADQTNGLQRDLLGNNFFKAQTNGSLIAHGGTVGLEFLW